MKRLQDMRMKVSTPKALPSQIVNDKQYCGIRVKVNFLILFSFLSWGHINGEITHL